jgi:hypothetical protein
MKAELAVLAESAELDKSSCFPLPGSTKLESGSAITVVTHRRPTPLTPLAPLTALALLLKVLNGS